MSDQISQVQAVVNAVKEVLGDTFVVNSTVSNNVLTSEQKQQVRELVAKAILDGTVRYSGDTTQETAFLRYVNGMVNNHLTRSKKLNGNVSPNPSSKGTKDKTLKELNKYLATLTANSPEYLKVAAKIDQRKVELAQVANKIDKSVVPNKALGVLNNS